MVAPEITESELWRDLSDEQRRQVLTHIQMEEEVRRGRIVARRWREPGWIDPCSSGRYFDGWEGVRGKPPDAEAPVAAPGTWLLRAGWRRSRGGRIAVEEVPKGVLGSWGP